MSARSSSPDSSNSPLPPTDSADTGPDHNADSQVYSEFLALIIPL